MKKIIRFIIPIGVIIALVVYIVVGGINCKFGSFYIFTTKYYNTPKLAFEKENDFPNYNDIVIKEDIKVYQIDEYNAIYLAKTKDDLVLLAPMIVKNGKYYSTGNYTLLEIKFEENSTIVEHEYYMPIYSKKGKKISTLYFSLYFTTDTNNSLGEKIGEYLYKTEALNIYFQNTTKNI